MTLPNTLRDWLITFWQILISPTTNTFIEEAEKSEDKFSSAIGWAVFIAIYSYALFAMGGYIFHIATLITLLLALPLAIILLPSATHFVLQRIFHRKQYLYDKFLYIYTAILVLFQIIINPIIVFVQTDIASIIGYIVIVYQFILFIVAVKAIAKIKYWQASVTIIITFIAGAIIFICAIPVISSLMGGVSRTLR